MIQIIETVSTMKKIFYTGLAGLALFEILKVYFIMPMPGSQEMESIDVAYFLHTYRWFFRVAFGLMVLIGLIRAFQTKRKWIPLASSLAAIVVIFQFNFRMTAESMFRQPQHLSFKTQGESSLNDSSLVIGVAHNGEAKAYPIRFMVYHHQVQDTIGEKPVLVTYCSVCRTGRVFEPIVNGHYEKFRLVGMDHFNAMFEDATTKTWWRQSTGEAIAGPLKGEVLPEVTSLQLTIGKWFELYPEALVMQLDEASRTKYDSLGKFEQGKSKGKLTRTDSLSWKNKSWVVGIEIGTASKAYDWNLLKEKRIINDIIDKKPIVLALSVDEQSFTAFERPNENESFTIRTDTLMNNESRYDFSGRNLMGTSEQLRRIKAYQEFWHSWRTFHPQTQQYRED